MSASSPPRVGVVGCGYWGRNLVRNFHALGALGAVAETTEAGRAVATRTAPGVEIVGNLEALLSRPDLGGIVLATPAATHAALGLKVLEAGKDLFVEKPMALTLADGRSLVTRAAEKQRILHVGHLLEYHPAITRIKQWIAVGRFGRLQRLHAHRLNFGKIRTEEDALWNVAPHDLAVILRLQGSLPEKVSCTGTHALGTPRSDFTVTVLHFADGVDAHILSSWLHPTKEQKLVLVGEAGMAVFDDTAAEEKLVFHDQRVAWKNSQPQLLKGPPNPAAIPADEPLKIECSAFLEAIAARKPSLTDGPSGLRVLAVLEACRRSMESDGQLTSVEPV